ncbi:MAG: RNase adapter RapZ [Rhodovibrionaceae bacterium]
MAGNTPSAEDTARLHGTCIAVAGQGVLLRGPSGAGKSDLALRLIDAGEKLVADDQSLVTRRGGRLHVSCPPEIKDRLEVRGLGLEQLPALPEAPLVLIVDLAESGAVERLPEPREERLLGVAVPRIELAPFEASAPAKVKLALQRLQFAGGAAEPAPAGADAAQVALVTGMSGAGRSSALKILEDLGFEAIDNLPLGLLPQVLSRDSAGRRKPLAIGMDLRGRDFAIDPLLEQLAELARDPGIAARLVFLDCEDEALRRRFTETRRRHPLAEERPLADGIAAERRLMRPLLARADLTIDTTELSVADLRRQLAGHFSQLRRGRLSVAIVSFSYRKGLPREADLVFDVRFLANPHYRETLRPLTGQAPEVAHYVESDSGFADFFDALTGLLSPLLPRYAAEGKSYLTIAVGCTGGRHRSVVVAERLAAWLRAEGVETLDISHRDIAGAAET